MSFCITSLFINLNHLILRLNVHSSNERCEFINGHLYHRLVQSNDFRHWITSPMWKLASACDTWSLILLMGHTNQSPITMICKSCFPKLYTYTASLLSLLLCATLVWRWVKLHGKTWSSLKNVWTNSYRAVSSADAAELPDFYRILAHPGMPRLATNRKCVSGRF